MSMTEVYRLFGVRGYRNPVLRFVEGRIHVHMRDSSGVPLKCSHCGSRDVVRRGTVPRCWSAPPVGAKPVSIFADVPRVSCNGCGKQPMVPVSFAVPGRSYTRAFEKYVLNIRRRMTVLDVADLLGVSEWMVRDIEKRWLGKHFAKPKLKHLKLLAIDEIATKKGHVYITLVMDLESGAVVFVGKGKGASALAPFWKRLKSSGAKVQALAMDMSKAYVQAASENLPNVPIVFDWFHIVKLFNDKLSQLRRELYREATDKLHKQVLKGTRWLLLKRPENLNPKKKELRRLKDALKLNESLATAYYLKEDLQELWHQPTKAAARRFLNQWIDDAMGTGIQVLQTFATTLQTYREGLLAWFDHPISTGPLEGTNNKIKTLKRQAYGFRDQEYFALKLLALHNAKWRLIG